MRNRTTALVSLVWAAAAGLLAVAPAQVAAKSAAAPTLPTGEEARPHTAIAADSSAIRYPVLAESTVYRSRSLAPGVQRLSSRFGWRGDPLGQGTRFHAGVDIPAPIGAAVHAVLAGRVVFAGWAGGYGNMVEIDHGGGVRSRYGHLEHASVVVGDLVGTRAIVGEIGSTGRSTGPHLHYEVRVGGMAIDPLRAAMPVRDVGMPDLIWPGSVAEPVEVTPRWIWQGANEPSALPEPVIR